MIDKDMIMEALRYGKKSILNVKSRGQYILITIP